MPTKNRRVATYLPEDLEDFFNQFKRERQLGDSQALMVILREYFGVSQSVTLQATHLNFVTLEQFEGLAIQVEQLSEKLNNLLSTNQRPPSELPNKSSGKSLSEKLRDAFGSAQPKNEIVQSAPSDQVSESSSVESKTVFLSTAELCRRLNVPSSTMSGKKKMHNHDWVEWTREKDPDGIGWSFIAESNYFQAVGSIPPELISKFPIKKPDGLTTGELAKRLGVDGSTISHRKKSSPQELVEWTRSKDPEQIGWILEPETNLFVPEKSLSDGSPTVQGELLSATLSDQINPLPKGSERSGEG